MPTVTTKTHEQVRDLALAFARNRMPDKAWDRYRDNYKRIEVNALSVTDLYYLLSQLAKATSPRTATGQDLDDWGELRGVSRKAANQAAGASAGRVRGTAASNWTVADGLTDTATGLAFLPTAGGSVPAAGYTDISLIAVASGSEGVLEAGAVLEWDSTPAGLEDQVTLVGALDDAGTGLDNEDDEIYRERVLAAWGDPILGGTPADYREWITSAAATLAIGASVATGYVWRGRNGKATVDVAGLKSGQGSSRLLSAGEQTSLTNYLDPIAPASDQMRVLDVTAETVDVDITVEPEPGSANARDWDDSGGLTVSSYTSGTRTLVLSADRPAGMKVGHRIVVGSTAGKQLTIKELSSTDAVVLEDDLGYTLTAAEPVYSGGGVIDAARASVLALFNSLGPRRGRYAAGSWSSLLSTEKLKEAASTAEGVLDSAVVTPASDTSPTELAYPNDAQVNLLVPGNLIVRYL